MIINRTYKALPKETVLTPLFLFVASVFFCMLVYRVYPHIILFSDSHGYYLLGKYLLHPQSIVLDHSRAPLYSAILYGAALMPHTSAILYWFHALLFCGNILLAYRIGQLVWRNTRFACAFTIMLLLIEVRSMTTLFYSTLALSDSLCAHLLFSSSLILAEGVIRGKRSLIAIACAVAGLSGAVRPVVFALIPFVIFVLLPLFKKGKKSWASSFLMLLLLIAPQAAWKIRNVLAYDAFWPNPFTGLHLTVHALPLMEDDDSPFGDPEKDAVFRKALTELSLPPEYSAPSPYSHDPNSYWGVVIGFLGSQSTYYQQDPSRVWDKTGTYSFQISENAQTMALRLIRRHPLNYARNVAMNYIRLFDVNSIEKIPYQEFSTDANSHYRQAFALTPSNVLLYPEFLDMPIPANPIWSDPAAARLLNAFVFTAMPEKSKRPNILTVAFPHMLFLAALWKWMRNRQNMKMTDTASRETLLLIVIFPVIALYHFTTAAITNMHDTRYAVPVLMLHHLFCLAGILIIIRRLNEIRIAHSKHDNDDWYTQTFA